MATPSGHFFSWNTCFKKDLFAETPVGVFAIIMNRVIVCGPVRSKLKVGNLLISETQHVYKLYMIDVKRQ